MQEQIANLFRRVNHGVYVIGVVDQGEVSAFTAAWVMQVSFNPLLVAISINPKNRSYGFIQRSGIFSINVLSASQQDLAQHFGQSQPVNKLANLDWHAGRDGLPLLDKAVAWLECLVTESSPAGDHHLLVAQVVGGAIVDPEARPLTYAETGTMDQATQLYPDSF